MLIATQSGPAGGDRGKPEMPNNERVTGDVTRDVTRDVTGDVTGDWQVRRLMTRRAIDSPRLSSIPHAGDVRDERYATREAVEEAPDLCL